MIKQVLTVAPMLLSASTAFPQALEKPAKDYADFNCDCKLRHKKLIQHHQ
jgi:hypothetical protein